MSGATRLTKILLISVFLVASACDDMKIMKIAADGNNPPTFKLSGYTFNYLYVSDEKGRKVWEINREGSGELVTSLIYGNLPTGYKETVPPEPLVEGQTYVIRAGAASGHTVPGELRFTVGKPSQAAQ